MKNQYHSEVSLFNRIARPYGWFFKYQTKKYHQILKTLADEGVLSVETLCDVGCGTGALAVASTQFVPKVYACDPADQMIRVAKMKSKNDSIEFSLIQGALPYKDQSMDVVTLSYVLHGMKRPKRDALIRECVRVAKKYVIIIEFNQKRNLFISLVEGLEGGDYENFIYEFDSQLEEMISDVRRIQTGTYQQVYLCDLSTLKK